MEDIRLHTREKLAEMGIDLSAEDNNKLSPSVNREFILVCTKCGCLNAKMITDYVKDEKGIAILGEDGYFISEKQFYCPNCKTRIPQYAI
jgi:hypothetical protein